MISLRPCCFAAFTAAVVLQLASPANADVLVAQTFTDSVVRYNELTGELISGWEIAPGSAGLLEPSGVTLGPNGLIYVSSRLTGEILRFDATTGAPVASPQGAGRDGLFGTLPMNPSQEPGGEPTLASPGGMRFGPDGNLYVSDNVGANVRVLDGATGEYLRDAAGGLYGAGGLSFLPDGGLLVSDFGGGLVYRVDENGQTPVVVPPAGTLQTPNSILLDDDGSFWVSDLFGNQIVKFAAEGGEPIDSAIIPPEIPAEPPYGIPSNFPSDVLMLPNGNLLVGVLGIENPDFSGINLGSLLVYDQDLNLKAVLAEGLSPVGAMALVSAVQPLPGDYDQSGTVDAADLALWKSSFGELVALGHAADGSGDGIVNAADYTVWRDNFPAVSGGAAAVPEPGAVCLLALGMLAVICSRRRR